MVIYKCDICGKEFKQKSNYTFHKNRKNPCIQLYPKIMQFLSNQKDIVDPKSTQKLNQLEKNAIECKYCNKNFKYKTNLYKHFNRCKIKKDNEAHKQDIFNQLLCKLEKIEKSYNEIQEENKKLRRKIKQIETKNIYTVNVNNNGNMLYNNNIKLVAYGKENRNQIDKKDVLNAIQGFATEIELTKLIHFNDKFPEYHNVYINNIKDKYAMIYDGKRWILRTKDDVIEDIYDTNKDFVDERMEDFVKSLDKSRMNALKRWLNTDETSSKIKKIKENIKLLLYNEKERAIKINDMPMIVEKEQ